MRITLVPDIPQEPIRTLRVRAEVIDVMKRNRQLNHAQVRGQMPAIGADGAEDAFAHLLGQLRQLVKGVFPQIDRGGDLIQN